MKKSKCAEKISIHSYTTEVRGNDGMGQWIDNEQRGLPWRRGCAGPRWFAQGFIPYRFLLCFASISDHWPLQTCLPALLLAGILLASKHGRHCQQDRRSQGGAEYFSAAASCSNSGSSCISPVTPPPTKQASHGPASTYLVTSEHELALCRSYSFLLTVLQVAAFFHLGFSACLSTV